MTISSIAGEYPYDFLIGYIKKERPELSDYVSSKIKKYSNKEDVDLLKALKEIGIDAKKKKLDISKEKSKNKDMIAILNNGNYCSTRLIDKEFVEVSSSHERKIVHKMELSKFEDNFYSGEILLISTSKAEEIKKIKKGNVKEGMDKLFNVSSIRSCVLNMIKDENPRLYKYIDLRIKKYHDYELGFKDKSLKIFGLNSHNIKESDFIIKKLASIGVKTKITQTAIQDASSKNHDVIAILNDGSYCLVGSITNDTVTEIFPESKIVNKVSLEDFNKSYSGSVLSISNLKNNNWVKKAEESVLQGEDLSKCILSTIDDKSSKILKYVSGELKRCAIGDNDTLSRILREVGVDLKVKKVGIKNAKSKTHKVIVILNNHNYCIVNPQAGNFVEVIDSKSHQVTHTIALKEFEKEYYSGKIMLVGDFDVKKKKQEKEKKQAKKEQKHKQEKVVEKNNHPKDKQKKEDEDVVWQNSSQDSRQDIPETSLVKNNKIDNKVTNQRVVSDEHLFVGGSIDSCIMSIIRDENPQLHRYAESQLRKYSTDDPDSLTKILRFIGLRIKKKNIDIQKAKTEYHDVIAKLDNGNCCIVKSIENNIVEIAYPKHNGNIYKIELSKFNAIYSGKVLWIKNVKGQKKLKKVKRYSWFWDVINRYKSFYTNVLVAAFMINIFGLAVPLFSMNVYDRVIPNYSSGTLWALASGVFFIIIFDFMLKMLRSYFVENTGKKIDLKLSNQIFAKTLHLLMKDHLESVGVRSSRIREFDSIRDFLSSITLVGIIDFPFLIITIAIIYYIGGSLAMIPIIALIIAVVITLLVNRSLDDYTQKSIKGSAQKNTLLLETLFNIETIKNLCIQPTLMNRWDDDSRQASKAISKLRFFSSFIVNCTSTLGFISSVSVVVIGTTLIWSSDLTIGGLIACSILTGRCLAPITQITTIITRFKKVRCSLESIDEMISLEDERRGIKEFYALDSMGNDIQFHNVSFSYPGQDSEFIKDLSFSIKEGEKVAILGNSGSGKSTLFKLLSGLYVPSEGSISISGVNIEQIDPYILRSNIGYVEQSSRLFSGTLWSNIVIKNPKATQEEVMEVVAISGINNFAQKHPEGYNMRISESGNSLSGGQIQSVSLARSLLSNPKILLLDEPTSFMDNKLEASFVSQMKKFGKDKTVIISTHKNYLLELVDRIIVIDDGKIVADNKKSAIMKKAN